MVNLKPDFVAVCGTSTGFANDLQPVSIMDPGTTSGVFIQSHALHAFGKLSGWICRRQHG